MRIGMNRRKFEHGIDLAYLSLWRILAASYISESSGET